MANSPLEIKPEEAPTTLSNGQAYWKANKRTIFTILSIWAFASLGMSILFVPFLSDVFLPGFQIPLGFWFAHQGAIVIFVVLIFAYAWIMDRIDRRHDVQE
ncbi:MAG: DUF4212 domain-containing protein [Ardenticatenaceae bacterium]|nr:DUF4212 domain-containing protein [Ardenticatenaceae bacterium]